MTDLTNLTTGTAANDSSGVTHLILLIAGMSFFMYGMVLSSQALEKFLAQKITKILNTLSKSDFLSVVAGISVTTVLQSSGAVTAMLVGLGSAQVISLSQVMGIILGTTIGSTLTVQLISLDIGRYALPVFSLSFFVFFLARKTQIKNAALVGMGFALLFYGMKMMSESSAFFVTDPLFQTFIGTLHNNPWFSFLVSALLCALIHSSAVTIGLAMGLAQAGAISLNDALFWVYGANVGTTSTALLAAAGGNYIARQVAWAHFFYKVISVVLFWVPPIHNSLFHIIQLVETSVPREIANGHLIFNVLSSIIFFPFIRRGAELMEKLIPRDKNEEFGLEFLNLDFYQSPALAISYAHREILRTADLVLGMIKDSLKLFTHSDVALIESIRERDRKIDFLYREIKMFLLKQGNDSSTEVQKEIMNMILFLSNLERAADLIDINLVTMAVKKNALRLEFSNEGRKEIEKIHAELVKTAMTGINSYLNRDLSEEAIRCKRDLGRLEMKFRENHISRLNRGLLESINTSSIHLDLLSEFKRIAGLLCAHAYPQHLTSTAALTKTGEITAAVAEATTTATLTAMSASVTSPSPLPTAPSRVTAAVPPPEEETCGETLRKDSDLKEPKTTQTKTLKSDLERESEVDLKGKNRK